MVNKKIIGASLLGLAVVMALASRDRDLPGSARKGAQAAPFLGMSQDPLGTGPGLDLSGLFPTAPTVPQLSPAIFFTDGISDVDASQPGAPTVTPKKVSFAGSQSGIFTITQTPTYQPIRTQIASPKATPGAGLGRETPRMSTPGPISVGSSAFEKAAGITATTPKKSAKIPVPPTWGGSLYGGSRSPIDFVR